MSVSSRSLNKLILSISVGFMLVLVASTRASAQGDCLSCDTAWSSQSASCYSSFVSCCGGDNYILCEIGGPTCGAGYDACLNLAAAVEENCLAGCDDGGGGGQSHEGGGGNPQARNRCVQSCDSALYDCVDNGGSNSAPFASCMETYNDVENCCDVDRSICLTGCL
jgi:hypothetical protein